MRLSRRELINISASLGALATTSKLAKADIPPNLITKTIPSSGEKIAAIGMGTWITFNVGKDVSARIARSQVLAHFFEAGGQLIDSSPMYGSSEDVIGYCLGRLGKKPDHTFSATKVWTRGQKKGLAQIEDSHRLWNIPKFDLIQVHNLVDWRKHLDTLLSLKKEGRLRYVGITTSHGLRHSDLIEIMKKFSLDFVQLSYNLADREAESKILPLAIEKGIAVIANRPLQGGNLFGRFSRTKLPSWVHEFDCENWAQLFLKFIISHPAITCAIPATSQVPHMIENMGALRGNLPDTKARKRIIALIE